MGTWTGALFFISMDGQVLVSKVSYLMRLPEIINAYS
jgi:hypothetical protein